MLKLREKVWKTRTQKATTRVIKKYYLASCVTLLNLSLPQFHHLRKMEIIILDETVMRS